MPLKQADREPARTAPAVAAAIDGDPQTGWSIGGGQGSAHSAVFQLAAPLNNASDLVIQLLFERYYAAGLGRFRISVTTDPQPDRGTRHSRRDRGPAADPARNDGAAEQNARLRRHYLMVAPELAKERAAIEQLRKEHAGRSHDPGHAGAPARQPAADLHSQPRRVPAADRPRPAGRALDLAPVAQETSRQPAGLGPLAGLARKPAVGAGDHEPSVGRVLRPRAGAHRGGFRLPGRAAQPPRAARLARPRAAQAGLVDEADAQADRHECNLSAVVARRRPSCWRRTRRTACWPAARASAWRRR